MKAMKYMTTSEVADTLGVHRTTAVRLLKADGVPLFRLGKGYRVRVEDFQKFLKARTH